MKKILLSVLAMVAVASCSQNNEPSFTQNDREVRISSSTATRMIDNVWQATDAIGVYMVAADGEFAAATDGNVKYTTPDETGSFTSETPFFFPPTGKVDLLAYYPHDATTVVTDYAVNVADQTAPNKIDLMKAAANDVGVSLSAVGMTFEHKLARIVLNISAGDGMTAADLKGLVVKLSGTSTTADYDLTTDVVDNHGNVADITLQTTTDDDSGVVTAAEAIVIPQTLSGAKLIVETKDDSNVTINTYEAPIATASFAVGKVYTYKMVIKGAEVKISSSNINSWTPDEETNDDDLNAELVILSTELTLATVDVTKIDEYADTWVITDENVDGTLEASDFKNLKDAVAAANDAEREITVVFPNLKHMPRTAMVGSQVVHVGLPKVKSLGIAAFAECPKLSSIDLSGVTEIGQNAFVSCSLLASVNNLGGCTIGTGAFTNCHNLNSIDLSGVTEIGVIAFSGCTKLSSIDLSGVTEIGQDAFANCPLLASVNNLGDCTIGIRAFQNCTQLSSIDLSGVTEIGNKAFSGCTKLSSIDLSGATEIGQDAFAGCLLLASVNNLGDRTIGDYVFAECPKLSSIDLSGVTEIGKSAFQNCTKLSSIDISGVTEIGVSAFQNCEGLSHVDLSAITAIGQYAFKNCSSLTALDNIGRNTHGGDLTITPPLTDDANVANMTLNFYYCAIVSGSGYYTYLVVDEDSNTMSWTYRGNDYTQQFGDIVFNH